MAPLIKPSYSSSSSSASIAVDGADMSIIIYRTKNGAGDFHGELIQFGSAEFPDWKSVLEYLMGA